MTRQLFPREPAVGIEPTTARIIEDAPSLGEAATPPSKTAPVQRRSGADTAPYRAEVPNDRPSADEGRIEAFLIKKWCYREYRKALRSGRLVPGPCFADGPECRGKKGNGHHHDYRYPRDVVWSCRGHHDALDALRRAGHTLASAMVEVLLSSIAPVPPPSENGKQ